MHPKLKNTVILLCLMLSLLTYTGCGKAAQTPALNTARTNTNSAAPATTNAAVNNSTDQSNPTTTTTEPTTDVLEFHGDMDWKDTNASPDSLCGANIVAEVSFDIHTIARTATIQGTGTITYHSITYNAQRLCGDCVVTAQNQKTSFTIAGTLQESGAPLLHLQPTMKNDLIEKQTSSSCFADQPEQTALAQQLFFSLEQAGFFDEWEIALPHGTNDTAEKIFSWAARDAAGTGTLSLTRMQ